MMYLMAWTEIMGQHWTIGILEACQRLAALNSGLIITFSFFFAWSISHCMVLQGMTPNGCPNNRHAEHHYCHPTTGHSCCYICASAALDAAAAVACSTICTKSLTSSVTGGTVTPRLMHHSSSIAWPSGRSRDAKQ
jgi:hypothetical protein